MAANCVMELDRKEFLLCHVLIIEDEAFVAMDIQQLLEAEGATSFAFAESEEAAVSAASAHRPDIITSDVRLSSGTGPEAVRIIQQRHGAIPVIFITGSPEDCEPCEPPAVVLAKPMNAPAVIKAFHAFKT